MMNQLSKRSLLYGTATLVLGGLALAVANGNTDADAGTLLSSADVQLRMAYAIPEQDKQGHVLESRLHLIVDAERSLATVERMQPGMAVTAEFLGFAQMMRGKYAEAAASYRRAQGCPDCQDEQRDVLTFNEARMLAKAGSRELALEVFAAHGKALDARYGHQRSLEEAAILRELGRRGQAEQRLDAVVRDLTADPMAWLQAGLEYEQLGHVDKADGAFSKAAGAVPIADYHRARLKVLRGEVDTGMELLERAAKAMPAEVRRRIQEEAGAWSAVAKDARFQELSGPLPVTPGR